ncbi:ABC transporter permease [Streptosporangiaceae bacterium NEAU-GS5]|nr:ABC transporter permease [Streptosporangiaceae bacterium NEAU-GS5]
MTLVRFWLTLELRRRWRSLAGLALLAAFAVSVTLTAFAGAVRGTTANDRLVAATNAATVVVRPFDSDAGFWAAARRLPAVAALTHFPGTAFGVDDRPDTLAGLTVAAADTDLFRTIETPVILDGRLPDPARVDEVVVTPLFRETAHKGVGDTVTLRLLSPARAAATNRVGNPEPPDGPAVRARIVGVIRSAWFAELAGGTGGVISSPALFGRYRADIIGAHDEIPFEGLVRLRPGATFEQFHAQLTAAAGPGVDMENLDATLYEHRRQVDGNQATTLGVFGLAAALAGAALIGQAVVRHVSGAAGELRSLRALGMTLRQQVSLASIAPVLAGTAGTMIGAAGAVGGSFWMPIGSAALHEPAPGIDVDLPLLAGGAALTAVVLAAGSVVSALAALLVAARPVGRRSIIAAAVARAGLPVPVMVGTRFALEPGGGSRAVAVRPALAAAVIGVAGVMAGCTYAAGTVDAAGNPARFGQTQQLEIYLGFGDEKAPYQALLAAVAHDRDVTAVNDVRITVAAAGGTPFPVFAYAPMGNPFPVVLSEGRMPERPGEIALGPGTAARAHVQVGGRVTVADRQLTVTGLGFLPSGLQNSYAEGGWVTSDGYGRLFGPAKFMWHVGHVSLRPGADAEAVAARLRQAFKALPGGEAVGINPPATPPPQMAEIGDLAALPLLLGGFLAVLAAGAVGHALASAVRRRRGEVGVLRALGLTRVQARMIVVTQAGVLAGIGLAVGVPFGVAYGRTVWRLVASEIPIQVVPPVAPLALALIVPVTLVVAYLLAALPSRAAARLPVATLLRAE